MNVETIFILLLLVWNVVLTAVLSFFAVKVKSFVAEVDKGDLIKLLDKVLHDESEHAKQIKNLDKEILKMQSDSRVYLQKVALMRFNPFEELGGDHSFTLALLDRSDDGILLTGLHTRERTRVYVKNISGGKSPIELSKEEQKVLKQAIAS